LLDRDNAMLAGPPRLVSIVSALVLFLLIWTYTRLGRAPSPNFQSATSSKSWMRGDPLDFGVSLRFSEGVPKPTGENYTWAVVVPKTKKEELGWLKRDVPDAKIVVYEVENPNAEYRVPKNKGREAMVYLTYMIDHYYDLPDTIVFIHAHRHAWHNNDLVMQDMLAMLKRLNHDRVARLGYMNMRCHQAPGCPDWIHMDRPGGDLDFFSKPEEIYMRRNIWEEIHPGAPIPASLSSVCCAQFAVSGDRVRQVPLERLVHYRKWLLNTGMNDKYSGRVFEYIWHYIFTGHEVYCPAENTCYCDGYGICMGGRQKYEEYVEKQHLRDNMFAEYDTLTTKDDRSKEGKPFMLTNSEKQRLENLTLSIPQVDRWLEQKRNEAFIRGEDPKARQEETETWESGHIWDYAPPSLELDVKGNSRPNT